MTWTDTYTPETTWMRQGACTEPGIEPELFTTHVDVGRAIAICRRCPVVAQCGAYAEEVGETSGVWGGRLLG